MESFDQSSSFSWTLRNGSLSYKDRILLMGILNVTPDSFSDGGRFYTPEHALLRAKELVSDGADLLDIGAESTRPGSEMISADEELSRLIPALKIIRDEVKVPISVDTYKGSPEIRRGHHQRCLGPAL